MTEQSQLQDVKNSDVYLWITTGLSLILALPFLALALYNHPSADDFLVTVPAIEWGPITSTLGWYKSWSARFSASFVLANNPLVFHSLLGYQLMAWAILAFLCAGFWKFLGSVFPGFSSLKLFSLALLSTLVYATATHSVVETLYYFAGAACYQPAHALFLILAGMLIGQQPIRKISELNVKSLFSLALKSGIIILIAGFNEVAMAYQLALIGGLVFFYFLETKKVNLEFSILFLVALFGAALVIFSPATFYRMEASQSFHRGLGDVIQLSIIGLFEHLFKWLKVASFVLLIAFWIINDEKNAMPQLKRLNLILISIFSVLLMIVCFMPSFMGEGMVQGRTANSLQFLFLFLLLINVFLWKKALTFSPKPLGNRLVYLPVFIAALAIFSPNSMQAWNDWFTGEAKAYNEEKMERIHLIETSVSDSVWVQPIVHRPKTIFFGDIGIFPQPWYDNFYAMYYGKKFIHLVDSTGQKRL